MHQTTRPDFAERVRTIVRGIPVGCVTTYGAIARALGSPRSARMVGWVLYGSSDVHALPAQRVVNRDGVLTGAIHFGHPDRMRELLEAEGVTMRDDIAVDMDRHFWDPADDPRFDALLQIPD